MYKEETNMTVKDYLNKYNYPDTVRIKFNSKIYLCKSSEAVLYFGDRAITRMSNHHEIGLLLTIV